jgi:hypothetical protein
LQSNPAVCASMMVGICRTVKSGWVSGLNSIRVCDFPSLLPSDHLQTRSGISHACQRRPICEILFIYRGGSCASVQCTLQPPSA